MKRVLLFGLFISNSLFSQSNFELGVVTTLNNDTFKIKYFEDKILIFKNNHSCIDCFSYLKNALDSIKIKDYVVIVSKSDDYMMNLSTVKTMENFYPNKEIYLINNDSFKDEYSPLVLIFKKGTIHKLKYTELFKNKGVVQLKTLKKFIKKN